MEMNPLTIVHSPHPVLSAAGRTARQHDWRPGETLRELLLRQGFDARQEIVITLNDRLLTVAEWDTVCPQPDDLITVQAVVSGGGDDDGGSNVGQIIATIVVIIVAYYTGYYIGGEWVAGGMAAETGISGAMVQAVTTAAVTMAGNMVVGAMFKPSGRGLSAANGLGDSSPSYSLSGGSNSLRPYEPLPVIFGSHRLFPDYGAKPYTEYRDNDQYLYQIFNFGLSDLALSDFRIGETPLSSYQEVQQLWSDAEGHLAAFPGNVDSIAGANLERGAAWTQRTSGEATTRLAIDIDSTAYYSTGRNYAEVTLIIEAQYAPVGSGAWTTMSDRTLSATSTHHWSARTTVTNGDGWSYETFVKFGSTVPGDHVENELEQVADDELGNPVYARWRWTDNALATAMGWPQPAPVTTYTYHANRAIVHKDNKAQRNTIVADVPAGQYDVRVRLTSVSTTDGEVTDEDTRGGWNVAFSTLRSYQEDTASYAGQRRMGLVIKATGQLNGVVQQLSCLAEASCLVWDGTQAVWAKTRNPAWWYLDFARGRTLPSGEKAYGCHLDWMAIDLPAIAAWAAFCDAEALTCDMILDRQQSAFEVLTAIAKCGLASPTWGSGKLGVVWDKRNASPVASFGMGNIIKGSFSVQYLTENLADEIVVTYVDRARAWSQQQVRVNMPGVTTPTRTSTVELMGCTDEAMAGKMANYLAAGQFYRRRVVTWDSDFEGFICQRGDVVLLSHDLTQWGYSGRLVALDGVTVTLDRQVPRTGATETLMLAWPDGTLNTYTASAGTGESDTLTLTEAPALQPGYALVDHRWFFSPLATPGKRLKIVSVRPVSASRINIVATDEDPAFYAAWDGAWGAPSNPTLLTDGAPVITGLKVTESIVPTAADGYVVELSVDIAARGAYFSAQLVIELDGQRLEETRVFGSRYTRIIPAQGTLVITAIPVSVANESGQPFTQSHTINGFIGALPRPIAPTIYASADSAGHVARAKVSVSFNQGSLLPISGLAFFLATFDYENAMVIANGGTGTTLNIQATEVIDSGTAPILAGSTPERLVLKTVGDPFDTSVNLAGRWWAKLPGGEWRKATGIDATGVSFTPPHNVTPVTGMVMEYAALAWADERVNDYRMAIVWNAGNYEVLKWGAVDQNDVTGQLQLIDCVRGCEGTTPISLDGKTIHYFPAPGPGSKAIVFQVEAFVERDGMYVAETDIDFSVPPGHFASLTAGIFYKMPDGSFIRSDIVPAMYGGPL